MHKRDDDDDDALCGELANPCHVESCPVRPASIGLE